MKATFSRRTSEKYSNVKFHEAPSSANRVVSCSMRKDRHDAADSSFLQFCERA